MGGQRLSATRVGVGQRVTEVQSGPAVVVVDQHERDEPLYDLDSSAASGELVGRGPPLAVVHDFDTEGVGFGPKGQLDGVVGRRQCVGVLDAVARRLAHGEH